MTTVISKVPEYDAAQPDGAGEEGAMAEVTPCGIGEARAEAANANSASLCMAELFTNPGVNRAQFL